MSINFKIPFFLSGVTKELEEVITKENFILTLKHIRPRKRSRSVTETLFAADFPGAEHKFLLLLDRKSKKGKSLYQKWLKNYNVRFYIYFSYCWDVGRREEEISTFHCRYTPRWFNNKFFDTLSKSVTTRSSRYFVPGLYFIWYGCTTENIQRHVSEYEKL